MLEGVGGALTWRAEAGIIMFNVISGRLHKKARLEVLLDDAYWPAFSTVRARSTHAEWQYIGEGVVKELDFSRVWLRLNEADEGDKDDVIAEWKGDAKAFLERTLDGAAEYSLVDPNDEDKVSVVKLEARYLPVPIKLEARESVNSKQLCFSVLAHSLTSMRSQRPGCSARRLARWPQYPRCRPRRCVFNGDLR